MLKLLVLTTLLSACLADEEAQQSASPVLIHHDEAHRLREGLHKIRGDLNLHRDQHHRRGGVRHRDDWHHHDDGDDRGDDRDSHHHHDDDHGPLILRTIRPHDDHPNIAQQDKIIEHVYSPDYAEPTWVLDYRYLKTGGRDYTRGPGGQILILPKGVRTKERKQFKNYDELIEHLKQKTLEERQKPVYFMPTGEGTIEQNLADHQPEKYEQKHDDEGWWQG